MKRYPLRMFISYAHEDQSAREGLESYLRRLEDRGVVSFWHDEMILPGTGWHDVIEQRLNEADLILFLISPDFEKSEFIRDHELPIALKRHAEGTARVIPVLLKETPGVEDQDYAAIQWLPSGSPLQDWDDQVDAMANVAAGIEQSARDLIRSSGGAFEATSRVFSDAELASANAKVRPRIREGMDRLRKGLQEIVPERRLDENLLIATWSLKKFGSKRTEGLPDAPFFVAQVISAFDLVCLQNIDINTSALEQVMDLLGPDWDFLLNDIAPGAIGNTEHMAILYYKPRVTFQNLSSQVMVPETLVQDPNARPGSPRVRNPARQFARPPMLARFRPVGTDRDFEVIALHMIYGSARDEAGLRRDEFEMLGDYLKKRQNRYHDADIIVLGNFNIHDLGDEGISTVCDAGIELPDPLVVPTGIMTPKLFDLIGWASTSRVMPLVSDRPGGAFDATEYAFRPEDIEAYRGDEKIDRLLDDHHDDPRRMHRGFLRWASFRMADHKLLWAAIRP